MKEIKRVEGVYEPFVYLISEVSSGRKYIGSKTQKGCKESDLGTKYFTSSKNVTCKWKRDRGSFTIVDIISMPSNLAALELEEFVLLESDAIYLDEYINMSVGGYKFNSSGITRSDETRRKLSEANTGKKASLETRKKISKANTKTVHVKDSDGNTSTVSTDDERFLSGELVALSRGRKHSEEAKEKLRKSMLGTVTVKDSNGNCFRVHREDDAYLCGLLVPVGTGVAFTEERRRKISESNKGKVVSEETRKLLSITNKGKIRSEETRKRMSKAQTGKVVSEETRKLLSEAQTGKKRTPEQNEANRLRNLGNVVSEETKLKCSIAMKNSVWMYNPEQEKNTRVHKDKIDEMIAEGWVLGQVRKPKPVEV